MALVINTNIMSLDAQRNLAVSTKNLAKSVERLSSGLRINSAADDSAGLAISNKLTAQTRSIAVAVRNAQDGVSMAQTTDGSLAKIGDILTRMRELAEESANGSLSNSDRSALNNEYTQMKNEIDRISNVTEFNGIKLLNGSQSTTGVTLQVGFHNSAGGYDKITFFSGVAATNTTNLGGGTSGIAATDISTATGAQAALDSIDSAINTVSQDRGTLGAIENRLDITISNLQTASENLTAANSRIKDADFAHETALFTQNQVIVQAGTAILAQANALPQNALTLLR